MGNNFSYTNLEETPESDDEKKQLEKQIEHEEDKEPVRPNVFSWISMHWIQELIRKGNKRALESNDLFPVDCVLPSEQLIEMLENAWNEEVLKASCVKGKKPKLWRALINMHGVGAYLLALLLNLLTVLMSVAQPIFLSFILSHLMLYGVDESIYMVYIFIFIIFLLVILMAVLETFFIKEACTFAVHFRSSLVGLTLKKVCR